MEIDVDEEVLQLLKSHAEPFVDSPNDVLRRLLMLDQATPTTIPTAESRRPTVSPLSESRAKAGTLLPESEYELPLLQSLLDNNGSAPTGQVREAVGLALDDKLTSLDREKLKSGDVRWHNRLQFVRLRLVERKWLKSDSPHGIWEISDLGREELRKLLA